MAELTNEQFIAEIDRMMAWANGRPTPEAARLLPEAAKRIAELEAESEKRLAVIKCAINAAKRRSEHIAELEAENARWRKAVEGLTPGGSEFVNERFL